MSNPEPETGRAMLKIGDWVHSSSGVGTIVKFDNGVPMIASGLAGHGFYCHDARPATIREIDAALRNEYYTDPEAPIQEWILGGTHDGRSEEADGTKTDGSKRLSGISGEV